MHVTVSTIPDERPGKRAFAPASTRRWARRRPSGDAGYALIELLVVCVAAVTVLTATFALLESSQQVQARDSEWALALQEDRAGLARMMRDLRQATKVEEAKTGVVKFLATIGGKKWEIRYDCTVSQSGTSYTECVRLAAEEGKGLPAKGPWEARDVVNGSEVFTYSPSTTEPKLVTAKVELPAKGALKVATGIGQYARKVVLENAAFVRNLYPEG